MPAHHPLHVARLASESRYKRQIGGTYCIHAPFFKATSDASSLDIYRQEIQNPRQPIQLIPPEALGRATAPLEWNDKQDTKWQEIEESIKDTDTVLYTDGSVEDNPGKGGAAVYIQHNGREYRFRRSLGGLVTISFAELTAIDMAADWLLQKGPFRRVFPV